MKYEIEAAKKLRVIEEMADTDRSLVNLKNQQLTLKYIGNIDGKLGIGTKKLKKVLPNMQHVFIK